MAKRQGRGAGLYVFSADWRAEPTLKLCTEGARLLWWEMLLIMAESERRGFLLINGRQPSPDEIAVLTNTDREQVGSRLDELERNGVFSRNRDGIIFSRRIVSDEKKAKTAQKNGRKGGNPTLSNTKQISASDNRSDKQQVNGEVKLSEEITLPNLTLPNLDTEVIEAHHEPQVPLPAVAGAVAPASEPSLKAAVWRCGVRLLGENARPLMGRWVRDYGLGAVAEALAAAERDQPADARGWITAALQRQAGTRAGDRSPMASHRRVMAILGGEQPPPTPSERRALALLEAMQTPETIQ